MFQICNRRGLSLLVTPLWEIWVLPPMLPPCSILTGSLRRSRDKPCFLLFNSVGNLALETLGLWQIGTERRLAVEDQDSRSSQVSGLTTQETSSSALVTGQLSTAQEDELPFSLQGPFSPFLFLFFYVFVIINARSIKVRDHAKEARSSQRKALPLCSAFPHLCPSRVHQRSGKIALAEINSEQIYGCYTKSVIILDILLLLQCLLSIYFQSYKDSCLIMCHTNVIVTSFER